MKLTNDQIILIVLKFKETKSCNRRQRVNEKFPERNSPNKKTVYRTVRSFYEHGSIVNQNKVNSVKRITQRTENNIAIVRPLITENPRISIRRNASGFTKTTFHTILKKDLGVHPYRMQIKHQLLPADHARRRAFCCWITTNRFIQFTNRFEP
ncbi:hypothetical protein FHG87_016261 [Trinorchestia longiramus]|nr:hypothetical protein FHG87_016261 [Trinorchestia longiramus]